jgi:hypothetical protein
MPLNSVFGWFIKKRIHQIDLFMKYPVEVQGELFRSLIDEAALTRFGIDHGFSSIKSVEDFKKAVPIRNYEAFKPYIDMDDQGYIITKPGTSYTNMEGVFCSGDAQDKIYRQAVTAAGSGCMAALDAERWLSAKHAAAQS